MIAFRAGRSDRAAQDLEPSVGEHPVEGGGELRVPIPDQERDRFRMLTDFHDQVPGHLGHPPVVWVGGDAKDPHALAGVFDDGEDVDGGAVEQVTVKKSVARVAFA